MHIAHKFPFETVVTQVCKTLWKPFPPLLALAANSSSHCAELQELLFISVHSTAMLPTSTSFSAYLPCPCCHSYFIGLCLVNGLVLLHLHVSEELQCLVGCKVGCTVATDRTEVGEAPEAVGQVVGCDKVRFLRNLISSVSSLIARPRRSLGSVLQDVPEMLLDITLM